MTLDYRHRLRALVNTDREPIKAEVPKTSDDGKVATFRLYDPIDSWGGPYGISAKEFAAALDEVDEVDEIRLQINSPGGDVFDGIAILNMLRSHDARVVATVEGIAASAASVIAAGADELVMARNSELMIHDAWGLVVGNASDMHQMADLLDRNSDNLAAVYAEKAGGDLATWRAAMKAETWYTADEAVEAGLADRVDTGKDAEKAKARFDLTIFNYAGRSEAPRPVLVGEAGPELTATDDTPTGDPDPDGAPVTPPEAEDDVDLELVARSLERLARL